jgi:general secretion pathway protein H
MELTGRKVVQETRATSTAGAREASAEDGYTLIEVVCVLAIVGMLAAIVLPAIPRGTSRPRLEGYAVQAAALLNADHDVARRRHADIATAVDAPGRTIRSGATSASLTLPADVTVDALLAARCKNRPAGASIFHLASGMSCGGVIALTRLGTGFQVRVNWLTGGAEVVPIN